MPPTYCPCPRPILKKHRPSTSVDAPPAAPRDESAQLLDIDPSVLQPLVHFPPTNTLCRTFLADSPSIYDRSPIVVTPNKCSLPARGCPGKTYLPGDEALPSPKVSKSHSSGQSKPAGRHPHPRAVRVALPRDDVRADEAALSHPMPRLVPDTSSSESDESDGLSSPPLEAAPMSTLQSKTTSLPPSSPRPPGLSIPAQDVASYLSPIPSPTTPIPFNSRAYTSFSRFSSHARSHSPSRSPCRDAQPSTSPTRRRRSHSRRSRGCSGPASPSEVETKYKSFTERSALASCALDVPDVGCLGGF